MNGFFSIDKPGGLTSHDVVARARRILDMKKIGHAGTLDPMATGLLVLATGRFTRLIRFVQDLEKEYVARIRFGIATDTLDADGAVLHRTPMDFGEEELRSVLPRFTGAIHQIPPMVSALKVGGRRLYDIARSGQIVERRARQVHVSRLELREFAPGPYPEAVVRVRCSKGTYIRTLGDDIAQALGGHASLVELRRTEIGSLSVRDAVPLSEWEESPDPEHLALEPTRVLSLATARVDESTAQAVQNGVRLLASALSDASEGPTAILGPDGTLLAVYQVQDRHAVPEVVVA